LLFEMNNRTALVLYLDTDFFMLPQWLVHATIVTDV
jgi:hypothetical protein